MKLHDAESGEERIALLGRNEFGLNFACSPLTGKFAAEYPDGEVTQWDRASSSTYGLNAVRGVLGTLVSACNVGG